MGHSGLSLVPSVGQRVWALWGSLETLEYPTLSWSQPASSYLVLKGEKPTGGLLRVLQLGVGLERGSGQVGTF